MTKPSFFMKARSLAVTACAAAAAVLVGCSTPQPLLDQANNGAALTMLLQAEMNQFRAVQSDIAQQRIESVRRQLASLATYQSNAEFDERVKEVAGATATNQLYADLRTLADSRGADEKALAQQLSQIDADLKKVLAPLPDVSSALDTTQKKLAAMGEELSAEDRIKIVTSFAREINAGIDDNKKKIEAAKANTATAPAQSPSSQP
jgi:flagellar biosynthesis chaperone FliJ